jgi:hypothetical protein
MHRIFGLLAVATAALALSVLIAGPSVDPIGGGQRALTEAPVAYTAWAWGALTGLILAWLATKDWGQLPQWLSVQRRRAGLLILGGLFASVLLLF